MSLAGVFLLTRHGDRMGFYQSPTSYTAKNTNLTVAGYLQEYQNGQDLRSMYLTNNDTTANNIQGIDTTKFESLQMRILADAGGEGTVIVDSANALLQGLYPPYDDTITLANGTTLTWPRAQLVQVQTIEPDQEVWLEGWTQCATWTDRLNAWYDSSEFKAQAEVANPFFESMHDILGPNRPAKLENAWNVFDFLNVESIHNASIAAQITPEQLAYARYWANYHEAGSFTDDDLQNVGNIAGQAILPPLVSAIHDLANTTNPLKFAYLSASYKPFMALFKLFNLPDQLSQNVVEYASAAVIEVRTDNTLRLLFRNGTTQDTFTPYALFNSSDANSYPIDSFLKNVEPYALNDLSSWCDKCGVTDARGCDVLAQFNGTGGAGFASVASTTGHQRVSPVVSGVIGALVTLAVVAFALAVYVGLTGGAKKKKQQQGNQQEAATAASINTHTASDNGVERKGSNPSL